MSTDWTAPGAEEVAPGVHRIPLPMPNDGLRAVNVYAIVPGPGAGERGATLIDGGWRIPEAAEALRVALAGLGLATADVGSCLVTHHHRDHLSLALELRRTGGVRVGLGEGERESIRASQEPGRAPLVAQHRQLAAAGAESVLALVEAGGPRALDPRDWEDPDDWLDDDGTVDTGPRKLRVMATPGHTRGHVSFVDDAGGLMFTGDHVLPRITPSIGFEAAPPSSPLADYLGSLARTLREPDRVMLPAHGPAGGSVHARCTELLRHHEVRLAATEAAVRAGAGTGFEVAGGLRWTRREHRLADLDPFNQMLAVCETLAHLEVLRAQGRARREAGPPTLWSI